MAVYTSLPAEGKSVSSNFDPYHRWLGISPDRRPVTHYLLLGISSSETDPDVIDAAAERQISHVRKCVLGPHAAIAERVLNELTSAHRCLLDAERRARYDAELASSVPQPLLSPDLPSDTAPAKAVIDLSFPAVTKDRRPVGFNRTPIVALGVTVWRGGRIHCGTFSSIPRVDQTPFFDSFVASLEQVESLFDDLTAVFRVVHPAPDNLDAYGGAIRDLIILGCTEVESQWKRVLKANSVAANDDRYTTNHYVRVLPVMRLDEYKVKLIRYPSVPEIAPFTGWDRANPTHSLAWYDTYNKVKHDREANYSQATLNHAISAVAACVVMLAAQFGEKTLRNFRFENLFQFAGIPLWEPKEWYYGPLPNIAWQQISCPM